MNLQVNKNKQVNNNQQMIKNEEFKNWVIYNKLFAN